MVFVVVPFVSRGFLLLKYQLVVLSCVVSVASVAFSVHVDVGVVIVAVIVYVLSVVPPVVVAYVACVVSGVYVISIAFR